MKKIMLFCSLLAACSLGLQAQSITAQQKTARDVIYNYLAKEKYSPTIDTSDQSVCFYLNEVLYYIGLSEDGPLLYSFQRKGFKLEEGGYKRSLAIIAANEVNQKRKVAILTVSDKRVNVCLSVYASTAESFLSSFKQNLALFTNIDKDFKRAYQHALDEENARLEKEEQERMKLLPPSQLQGHIANGSFRILDGNDHIITDYDKPLRSFNARFIQTRLSFTDCKGLTGKFEIQTKITRPDGTPIYINAKTQKYSSSCTIEIEGKKKDFDIDFPSIGTEKDGYWKAGEYKVQFFESGVVFYETTFNLL